MQRFEGHGNESGIHSKSYIGQGEGEEVKRESIYKVKSESVTLKE